MIRKAVIPAAGLGTRLTPATKEQPKEMLPIFSKSANGYISLKPFIQLIFENLYGFGIREFCFIIGRGKRVIEDHFTQDHNYLDMLEKRRKKESAHDLLNFYKMLELSKIVWMNQPEPKGFGDAVLRAKPLIDNEKFLVYAGDNFIISKANSHLNQLLNAFESLKAQAVLFLQETKDPRQHGIAEIQKLEGNVLKIRSVVEKPENPISNLGIVPVYLFDQKIFEALEGIEPGIGNELQLTDAIQRLVEWGHKVYAVKLGLNEIRLDIGNPTAYWEALKLSYEHSTNKS